MEPKKSDTPVDPSQDRAIHPLLKKRFPFHKVGILLGILLILSIVFLVGQFFQSKGVSVVNELQSQQLYKGKITIGYVFWPGYIGLIIASEKGYFKEAGLDVEMRAYPSLAQVSNDYLSGEIQGKANLTPEAISEALDGFAQETVLVIDYSNGSDGIIASSDIKNINQTKGKKVGYEFGTLEEFLISYALEENNLTLEDIDGVNLSPDDAANALVNKQVDVAVTYEPFMSPALEKSGGNIIYSSADAPGLITDILTFNKKFVDENPATIQAIVNAYFKALDFMEQNPEESYAILAKVYKTPPEDIKAQLSGVKILSLDENKTAFTYKTGLRSIYGNMQTVSVFVKKVRDLQKHQLDTDTLVNPQFIQNLSKNN